MASRFLFDHWLGRILRKTWHAWWRFVRTLFYDNREYTVLVPFGKLVYSPWFDPSNTDFQSSIKKLEEAGPSIVSRDRCHILHQFCGYAMCIPGAFAECGTYAGGTAHLLALTIADLSRRNQHPEPT